MPGVVEDEQLAAAAEAEAEAEADEPPAAIDPLASLIITVLELVSPADVALVVPGAIAMDRLSGAPPPVVLVDIKARLLCA